MTNTRQTQWLEPPDGAVLEIPLAGGYGWAYAKYVSQRRHPSLGNLYFLLRVFDFVSPAPLADLGVLAKLPYALDDVLVSGLIPAVAQGRWAVAGTLPIRRDDTVPPTFRKQYPRQKASGLWMLVLHGGLQELPCPWEEVRYLPDYVWHPVETVELALSLHFLQRDGVPPQDYLDLADPRVQEHLAYQRTGFAW